MHVFLPLLTLINLAVVNPYAVNSLPQSPLFRMKQWTTQKTSPANLFVLCLCSENNDKELNFGDEAASSNTANVEIDDCPNSMFDPMFTEVQVVWKTLLQQPPILLLSLALWYSLSGPVLPADALSTTDKRLDEITTLINGLQKRMDLAEKKLDLAIIYVPSFTAIGTAIVTALVNQQTIQNIGSNFDDAKKDFAKQTTSQDEAIRDIGSKLDDAKKDFAEQAKSQGTKGATQGSMNVAALLAIYEASKFGSGSK